jgi:hypothetical protein
MEIRGALERQLEEGLKEPPPPPSLDLTPVLHHLATVEKSVSTSLEKLEATTTSSTSTLASHLDTLPGTLLGHLSMMEERLGGAALEATRAASATVLQCVKDQSPPLHTLLSSLDQAVKLSTASTARAIETHTSPLLTHLTTLCAEASDARAARNATAAAAAAAAALPPAVVVPSPQPSQVLERLSSVEQSVASVARELQGRMDALALQVDKRFDSLLGTMEKRLSGVVEAVERASGVEAGKRGVEEGERMKRLESMNHALLERLDRMEVALRARDEAAKQQQEKQQQQQQQGHGGGVPEAIEALAARLTGVEGLLKNREATLTTLLEAGADSALTLKLLALKFLGEENGTSVQPKR